MARFRFAVRMAVARIMGRDGHCPYCQSRLHRRLQRKYLLIEARKCEYCGLIFRFPTDSMEASRSFYEGAYARSRAGKTLPDEASLEELLASRFVGSPFDRSDRISLLRSLVAQGRVLDFGCSWGYGLWQLRRGGYNAVGFELACAMAQYGARSLGVSILTDIVDLTVENLGRFDLILTDHVLEHTVDLREPLQVFSELLRPGGYLVIFVPNAGGLAARRDGVGWGPFIGETHTIAFTPEWLRTHLPLHGFDIERLTSQLPGDESFLDGEEIVCIATRRTSAPHPIDGKRARLPSATSLKKQS